MIKLKKLIAIAVLVSMLPRTVMAQGDGKKKNAKASEGQNVRTTETEPNEESFADMTATSEHETSESMELPDEQSRYEENKHSGLDSDWDSGSEADSEPDLDSDEYPVCTETAMVDDEENTDMPKNRKESTTETKSDKDDVAAIAASNQEEKEKSANNMYMQGVQCENNMEFCKAIEFYKQATELGSTAAASKLAEFHLYDENDFYKMYEWCEWASILFRKAECLKDLNSRYKALPSCADPIPRFLAHNQIYECKIELNSLKNKLKSLELNLFIMKDKIKNSPFAWYKNAAKIISMYLDTLQSENIEISPEPLYDFLKCCEIIKNENPEKVLNWFEIASKSGNADVMCKLAEYYETRQRIKKR